MQVGFFNEKSYHCTIPSTGVHLSTSDTKNPLLFSITQLMTFRPPNIDLSGKLGVFVNYLYIQYFLEDTSRTDRRNIYIQNIKLSVGAIEDDKLNIKAFEQNFQALILDFQANGFDPQHPILLRKNGLLENGEHRLACCLYFKVDPLFQTLEHNTKDRTDRSSKSWLQHRCFTTSEAQAIITIHNHFFPSNLISIEHYKLAHTRTRTQGLIITIRYRSLRSRRIFKHYLIALFKKLGCYQPLHQFWRNLQ